MGQFRVAKSPYVSFVLYCRNDNYGGDFTGKLELSLNFLIGQLTDHELDAEIIIVEWNPPEREPLLQRVLRLRRSERVAVRFIIVPRRFHRRLREWNKMPGSPVAAVNVGIRRARGQFVLVRASDVFYSEQLVQFLARRELRTDRVYRLNRVDVPAKVLDAPVDDRRAFLDRCVGSDFLEHLELERPHYAGGVSLHTNACGDFILVSRKSWEQVRGFPETGTPVTLDADGLALYALFASGLEQEILPSPHRVFKIRHAMVTRLRNQEEPLTPLLSEFEESVISDFEGEFHRSGLSIKNFGDAVRFVVRVIFNEPRRRIHGVEAVDHPSYAEYLYRTSLLSERSWCPLLTRFGRLFRFLDEGVAADIKRIPRLRWRLAFVVWNLWTDYHRLDRRLFSYRRLIRRLFYLAFLGLAPRPYIMNGRLWGLGKVHDLLDWGPSLFLD